MMRPDARYSAKVGRGCKVLRARENNTVFGENRCFRGMHVATWWPCLSRYGPCVVPRTWNKRGKKSADTVADNEFERSLLDYCLWRGLFTFSSNLEIWVLFELKTINPIECLVFWLGSSFLFLRHIISWNIQNFVCDVWPCKAGTDAGQSALLWLYGDNILGPSADKQNEGQMLKCVLWQEGWNYCLFPAYYAILQSLIRLRTTRPFSHRPLDNLQLANRHGSASAWRKMGSPNGTLD